MRKKIVAANWKMNKTFDEGTDLVNDILPKLNLNIGAEVIFFPPFIHLEIVNEMIFDNNGISVGAQNCHHAPFGAFTGEISAGMIASCGAKYVLIGHSERRQYCGEDNELCARKINQALPHHLNVIYCCGEGLEEREAGKQNEVVKQQIEEALFHLSAEQMRHIHIAYEPVWAIGTGRTATAEQAQEMHAFIRQLLDSKFSIETATATSILYGGSCNAGNAESLFSQPDVDGGLIGGASLKADEFVAIVAALR